MAGKLAINSAFKLKSGYEIPVLGFGVYQIQASEVESLVGYAIKIGYRHVDSAAAYRNEASTAAGLLNSDVPRDKLFFTSKVAAKGMSYDSAVKNINDTLQQTGLDYIDLYLIHAPYGGREARLGAWQALVEAVEAGKVRSIGVSNFAVHHLKELETWISEKEESEGKGKGGILSVNQVELHPWLMRPDIVKWCQTRGILLQAFSPLVRGQRMDDAQLLQLSQKYSKTPAQILLRWSLQKGFNPLVKSVNQTRIAENGAIFDFMLSAEDVQSLETDQYAPCTWDPTTSKD